MISEDMDEIKKQLEEALNIASCENKPTVFLIGNTAKNRL